MDATETRPELLPLDTSDVDRWVGQPVGGDQLKEPMSVNDIRRWAQAMQNPNPLYYDEQFAAASAFGEIVAPQSFTICCDVGHGAVPAIQGEIPGSHMLFGGDEWWFPGPRIRPGDQLRSERMALDYRVADTSFAGPTVFQRGDTTYINQAGEVAAKQRSTSIRYIAENARRLGALSDSEEPAWSDAELARIDAEKFDYYRSFQDHVRRSIADVSVGEELPRGVLGPHSIASFTTEWRAYTMNIWGATRADGSYPSSTLEAGWLPEMARDREAASVDPEKADGLKHGPSRGHVQERYAQLIGMPRAYGYGASMGAWVIDYVSNWAGELGRVAHSNMQYRSPALSGEVTYLDANVVDVSPTSREPGAGSVRLEVSMTAHTGTVMARGTAEVRLPAEAS